MNLVAVVSIGNRSRVGMMSTRKETVAAGITIVDVIVENVRNVALLLNPLLRPAPSGRLGDETSFLEPFLPRYLFLFPLFLCFLERDGMKVLS